LLFSVIILTISNNRTGIIWRISCGKIFLLKAFRSGFISEKSDLPVAKKRPLREKICLSHKRFYLSATKNPNMKKALTIILIAASLAACNGSGTDAAKADSAISTAADSVKATMDSTAVKVDSTIKAAADTAKAKINDAVDSAKKAIKK
jgi:predicted small secreted protein